MVHAKRFGGRGQHVFKRGCLAQQRHVFGSVQTLQQGGAGRCGQIETAFFGTAQHGADAGVGVLHIINRVVQTALLGQFKVKVQGAVALARKKHEARGVNAHFLDDVGQRFKRAGAGGHAYRLAFTQQIHKLDEHHVKAVLLPPHGGDGGAHARNVTVMVRAPDINEPVVATVELVVVIGDVGGEIGQASVRLAQHAVFVVAQLLGSEPEGVFLLIGVACGSQGVKSGGDGSAFHQGFFGKPALVLNAKFAQIILDAVQDVVHGLVVAHVLAFGVRQVRKGWVGFQHFAGDVDDVIALVIIFGPGDGNPCQFLGAQPDGKAKQAHLAARVIDVVFRVHVVPGHAQQAGQAVAHGRAATMSNMQGAGRIGGNILHQHLVARAARALAVIFSCGFNVRHRGAPEILGERYVAETRPRGFRAGHFRAAFHKLLREFLGQLTGICFGLFGQQHGGVDGKIAVLGVARRFNDGFYGPGKAFFLNNGLEGRAQGIYGAHSVVVLENYLSRKSGGGFGVVDQFNGQFVRCCGSCKAGRNHFAQNGLGPQLQPAARAVGILVAHCVDPQNRRSHLLQQAFAGAFAVMHGLAVGVAVNGKPGLAPHGLAQQRGQFFAGFGHHGAVKRSADFQLNAASLALLGFLAGKGHSAPGAADNELAGCVVVGDQHKFAAFLGGFGHNFLNGGLVKLEQGGHAPFAFRVGLGHKASAQRGEFKNGFGRKHARRRQGAEFAKAVPGGSAGLSAARNGAPEVHVHHGQGWLQGAGVAHGGVIAFPVDFPQGQAAYALGLLPQVHGFGRGFGQIAAHAGFL